MSWRFSVQELENIYAILVNEYDECSTTENMEIDEVDWEQRDVESGAAARCWSEPGSTKSGI